MAPMVGSSHHSSPFSVSPKIMILFVSLVALPFIAMITTLVLRYYPELSIPILSSSATLAILSLIALIIYWIRNPTPKAEI